jgi:peptide deformylase
MKIHPFIKLGKGSKSELYQKMRHLSGQKNRQGRKSAYYFIFADLVSLVQPMRHMAIRDIILLGDPRLYEVCSPVAPEELTALMEIVEDLHDTLMDFRTRYDRGRAIAAPQIGVTKRIVYMKTDEPAVFINPTIDLESTQTFELWDDCLSFPDLLVKVRRYRNCRVTYRDLGWNECSLLLSDSLAELLQHECDHLDGILAVARAVDSQAFALRSQLSSVRDLLPGPIQFSIEHKK